MGVNRTTSKAEVVFLKLLNARKCLHQLTSKKSMIAFGEGEGLLTS